SPVSAVVTRGSIRAFVERHRLVAFFTLAYLFSWYPWLIALARGTKTGPNPLGPFVAAMVVLGLAEGWPGVRALFSRMVRGRIGLCWYAVVFALPFVLCAIAFGLTNAFGFHSALPAATAWRELPDRFIFIFLFIALGEEPGWRGFALPELLKRYSPLVGSCILATLWSIWHLPLFGFEFAWTLVPAFVVSVFGGTLVQTWLFSHTRGSVLAQMLLHATVNTVTGGLMFPLFGGNALFVLWSIYAALWLITGAILICRTTR
ncbi:MAG: type II CAAX prenyl endopeptidase Rce1 family protein, partial [Chthoniobacterales bacterium]